MSARPLKILFLGAMAVGKTSLIVRMTTNTFESNYKSTLGVQLHQHDCLLDGMPLRTVLWDTDGDAATSIFSSPYIRGTDAAMLVCDTQRLETVKNLIELADAMQEILPGRPFLGVMNKTDLVVPSVDIITRIEDACDYTARTSALTGEGISEAFALLVRLCLSRDEG